VIEAHLDWDFPCRNKAATLEADRVLRVRLRPQATSAQPIRVALALDISGSMQGQKLAEARQACLAALRVLRPQDRISLIAYSTGVRVLLEDQQAESVNQAELQQRLLQIEAEGITRTDLALKWIEEQLRDQSGPRFAILATDGHPTDLKGQPLEDLSEFDPLAQRLGRSGVSLSSLGLGDASNFHPRFLLDLADRGQGRFFHAASEGELTGALQQHFARATAVGVENVRVFVQTLLPRLQLSSWCVIAPEFRPMDRPDPADGGWQLRVFNLQGQTDTDLLIQFRFPKPGFAERTGVRPVLRLKIQPKGGVEFEQEVSMEFVASSQQEQQRHEDVHRACQLWELNTCQDAVVRSSDLHRTGRLLQQLEEKARVAGLNEVVDNARAQLTQLAEEGRFDPNSTTRNSQILRELGASL